MRMRLSSIAHTVANMAVVAVATTAAAAVVAAVVVLVWETYAPNTSASVLNKVL